MQPNEPTLGKCPNAHCIAAVVVGITDNETRQHEEEIDGQIAVINNLVEKAGGKSLAYMVANNNEGGNAAQPV